MKTAEIRELKANGELTERIATVEAQSNQMDLNHRIPPLGNTAQIQALRRTIARMKTVLNEK